MSEEQKRLLEQQLWKIADEPHGKTAADEFRDYIFGFTHAILNAIKFLNEEK